MHRCDKLCLSVPRPVQEHIELWAITMRMHDIILIKINLPVYHNSFRITIKTQLFYFIEITHFALMPMPHKLMNQIIGYKYRTGIFKDGTRNNIFIINPLKQDRTIVKHSRRIR